MDVVRHIWVDDAHEAIEVKTIVDITVAKVKGKLSLVLRMRQKQRRRVDRLWVAFFYKFRGGSSSIKALFSNLKWFGALPAMIARWLTMDY